MNRSERRRAARDLLKPATVRPMAERPEIDSPAIVMLMPTRGRVCIETLSATAATDKVPVVFAPAPRMKIIEARNHLAGAAPMMPKHSPFVPKLGWFCLWVDDDAFWTNGTILRMLGGMAQAKVDILAGWFCGRAERSAAKAFYHGGRSPRIGIDCSDNELVEIDRCGFHFVMHRLELLEELKAEYGDDLFSPGPVNEHGEDVAFCRRARNLGKRIFVHTGCPIVHIDDDGFGYLPNEPKLQVVGGEIHKVESLRDYGLPASTPAGAVVMA